MYPAYSTFKKAKYGILLRLNLSKMKKWARICPENFQHKYLLVLAEWARVQGKNVLALQLYEKAVQKASTNGFLQNEAMAAELTGKFYIAMDLGSGAHPHLIRAQKSYTLRGCKLKLKQLSQKYPHVLPPYYENQVFENAVEEVTDEIQFSKLDLISINKASQAISKEISRDELIQKLLKITIENTCAGRGILFLNNAENILKVEAVGEFYTENIIQLRPKETFFSTAVVNLVTRSKNLLVLNDISEESDYANDKYILENNIKSLLCIPILAQSELLGLFYLENNYTTNAFTVKNMEVLNILVSQAAISLKNAELFNEKVTLTVQLAEKNNGLLAEIEGRQVIEKKLNQKNEELNTFLYRSSHDLRGPLASIMGLSTIAKNEITDKSATIYFDMIHQSTSKLDHILLDLVQVAQAKQTALLKQEIYLDILLHEVIDSLKFSKDFNKLRIDIKGKGGVVFWSDKSALITIVQNILENAFRYRKKKNDDSFLEIDIDSNEKEIHLNFRDNGIGIPKEMIDKIFEMFFKSNEDANSSGLGLYIVKCAIEKLKGSISVYSDGFSGTEFKVVLPVYS
jgi:signal transduction histidine kinase